MAKRGRPKKNNSITEEQKLIDDIRAVINEPSARHPEKMVEEVLEAMPDEEPNSIKDSIEDSIKEEPIAEEKIEEEEEEEWAEPQKRETKQIALIAVKKEYVGEIISMFMSRDINTEIKIIKGADLPDAVVNVYEY